VSSNRSQSTRRFTHGGARPGAGRPRKNPGRVRHVARPSHSREHPLHVTLRIVRGVRSLRGSKLFRAVRSALGQARARFGMRLVHYSVQSNHLHLIVEAADRRALTRGMQGLAIRLARRVNTSVGRRGRLWNDRYHARALKTPLAVRRVLVYVLRNDQRHWAQGGLSLPPWRLDPCSSAATFDGFAPLPELALPGPEPPCVTVAPACFLLKRGWRRHGPIGLDELPGEPRSGARQQRGLVR
jgi:REP-associated tyrosine transposase